MGPTIEALTRDFSWSVIEALRSYDAERTGVPCPAFLLKNATQARQAFHGSVLRRRDGTYHIVDFTGGVKTSGDAICLMLKPLAGGPAKQFYPAELAQSVEWISMACLSNKSFSDTSDTPPLKQGGRAVAGIKLAGTQIDCRILWDETKHQIRLDTASGTVQELEGATPEQISKKTDLLGAPWDVARPEINQELLEGIRGRVVDVDDFLSGLAEAVWAQEHGDLTQRQQQQLLASTAHDDASLVRCHASAGQHFDRMLGSILIIDRSELTFGFLGAFLAALAGRQHLGRLAMVMLAADRARVTAALASLFDLLSAVRDLEPRLVEQAMETAEEQETAWEAGAHRARLLVHELYQRRAPPEAARRAPLQGAQVGAAQGRADPMPVPAALAVLAPVALPAVAPPPPAMPPPPPPYRPAPAHPPAAPALGAPPGGATRASAIDWLTPAGVNLPSGSDDAAVQWMFNMGGDVVQKFVAMTWWRVCS